MLAQAAPQKVIVDMDIGDDIDDAFALGLLLLASCAKEKVVVSAILAEVTTGDRAGWSVSLIGSAISSKLGLTIGAAGGSLSNGGDALTFRSADFGAVLGAISTASGTRIRSTPRVAGRSGEALRLQTLPHRCITPTVFAYQMALDINMSQRLFGNNCRAGGRKTR